MYCGNCGGIFENGVCMQCNATQITYNPQSHPFDQPYNDYNQNLNYNQEYNQQPYPNQNPFNNQNANHNNQHFNHNQYSNPNNNPNYNPYPNRNQNHNPFNNQNANRNNQHFNRSNHHAHYGNPHAYSNQSQDYNYNNQHFNQNQNSNHNQDSNHNQHFNHNNQQPDYNHNLDNTQQVNPNLVTPPKSKVLAVVLALLIGWGIHSFYLGRVKQGVAQLCLHVGCIVLFIVGSAIGSYIAFTIGQLSIFTYYIWVFVDIIRILAGKMKDGKGNPLGYQQANHNDNNQNPHDTQQVNSNPVAPPKSKVVAAVLALFIGLGIYSFYLGHTKKAIAQLCLQISITLLAPVLIIVFAYLGGFNSYGIMAIFVLPLYFLAIALLLMAPLLIWTIVDAIRLSAGKLKDNNGNPLL